MNCQEFETIIVDLVRGEVADSVVATGCWAHAANCSQCSERLLEQEKLTAGLQALANRSEQMVPAERIEAVLRREFRNHFSGKDEAKSREPRPAFVPVRVAPIRARWAWAVAAAVILAPLVAVLATKLRTKTPAISIAQNLSASQVAGSQQAAGQSKAKQSQISGKQAQSRSTGARPPSKPSNQVREKKNSRIPALPSRSLKAGDELVSNFYPLPYGSGLSPDDGWEIVRVAFPRSQLASLGVLATNDQTNAGSVKADIVLGADGLARAIRFVE